MRRDGYHLLSFSCAGRNSEFLKGAQESYGVFTAQHSDNLLRSDDGHLVYAISIHILKRGPQLGVRIDAFQLFEGDHDLNGACCRPFVARHLLDTVQGYQTDRLISPVDKETTLPAAEDLIVDQLLDRQIFRNNGATRTHGLRHAMACQQASKCNLLYLD